MRMHDGRFTTFVPPDPLGALERLRRPGGFDGQSGWPLRAAWANCAGSDSQVVIPAAPLLNSSVVTLCEGRDGALWAGTYGKGLWRIAGRRPRAVHHGRRPLERSDPLALPGPDGTLWIGTFGGGLNALRDGHFSALHRQGRPAERQHRRHRGRRRIALAQHHARHLPHRQAAAAGFRRPWQAHAARARELRRGGRPAQRAMLARLSRSAAAATAPADGRLWFTTSRGLAVFDPKARKPHALPPVVHLRGYDRRTGEPVDLPHPAQLAAGQRAHPDPLHRHPSQRAGTGALFLPAGGPGPRLGARRYAARDQLQQPAARHITGSRCAPSCPAGRPASSPTPSKCCRTSTRRPGSGCCARLALLAAAWAVYQLRLRQIRSRFALVLEERARLAREIHDTLAQGFVGISSQLDAVAMCMPDETAPGAQVSRPGAAHGAPQPDRSAPLGDGPARFGAGRAGSGGGPAIGHAHVDARARAWMWTWMSTGARRPLPQEMEQHLLRIAQEAVTNVLKHAGASQIWIKLHTEARKLYLRIVDNGRGFEQQDVFAVAAAATSG